MKIRKLLIFSALLCIVVCISNCTVQKRSYRNGYYVSWNKKASQTLKVANQIEANKVTAIKINPTEILNISPAEIQKPLFASAYKLKKLEVKSSAIKPLKLVNDSCGDIITLRDGTEILGKVIEVAPKTIKYKRCNNIDGPLIIVGKENVVRIKYTNGTTDVFKNEDVKNENVNNTFSQVQNQKFKSKRVFNSSSIISFISSCLFILPFAIPLSLVFGIIALNQIKENPEKYKGKWMAVFGVVFSSFLLLVIIAVMVAVIVMF